MPKRQLAQSCNSIRHGLDEIDIKVEQQRKLIKQEAARKNEG